MQINIIHELLKMHRIECFFFSLRNNRYYSWSFLSLIIFSSLLCYHLHRKKGRSLTAQHNTAAIVHCENKLVRSGNTATCLNTGHEKAKCWTTVSKSLYFAGKTEKKLTCDAGNFPLVHRKSAQTDLWVRLEAGSQLMHSDACLH